MEELQKAVVNIKKACPDHYFVIIPEHIRLEEIPEDILLDAGWIKISRLPENQQEELTKKIKKDANIQILRNLRDSPPRIPGKGAGKG